MALTTTIYPTDIAVALGQPAPEPGSMKWEQWDMWTNDALMLIEVRLDATDSTMVLDQSRLDYVIREAVTAHARRPEDLTQVSVSVDDTSTQKTYRSGTGRVAILDEWWSLLGLSSASGSGAFSIFPSHDTTGLHQPWCSLAFGALYCSCGADLTGGLPLWEY